MPKGLDASGLLWILGGVFSGFDFNDPMGNCYLEGGRTVSQHGDIPDWANPIANSLLINVKLKDIFTFYHCCRVGRNARRLAQALGLSDYDQFRLEFAGLFHDIGKIGISENILQKPGKLTDVEYGLMKAHPLKSTEVIEPLADKDAFFKSLLPGIRSHHEKIDGRGYPFGLEGDQIPLAARIISVVDTVDAMMNTRPYRRSMSMEEVRQELINFSGRQFDAQIVKIYLEASRFWKDVSERDQDEYVINHILTQVA